MKNKANYIGLRELMKHLPFKGFGRYSGFKFYKTKNKRHWIFRWLRKKLGIDYLSMELHKTSRKDNYRDVISRFIIRKQEKGVTELSIIDIHLATKISAPIISSIMERWEREGKVREIRRE